MPVVRTAPARSLATAAAVLALLLTPAAPVSALTPGPAGDAAVRAFTTSAPAVKTAEAKKRLRTLVIPVYWKGAGKDAKISDLRKRARASMAEVNDIYRTMSRGKHGYSSKVIGWQKIAPPAKACGVFSQLNEVGTKAIVRAMKSGVNLDRYDRAVVYVTSKACGGTQPSGPGIAATGGQIVLLEGTLDSHVIAHHLGRTLGVEAGNHYECGTHRDRRVLAKPKECTVVEGGDAADLLSAYFYTRTFSGPKLAHLGWLAPKQLARNTSTKKKTYTLRALASKSKKTKVVRVRASKTRTYWIEYRRQVGLDRGLPNTLTGVQIRMTDTRRNLTLPSETLVLDMHPFAFSLDFPEVPDNELVSLAKGSTWVSPEGIRFAVRKTGKKARVTVTRGAKKARTPTTPTGFTVTPVSQDDYQVRWDRSKDNGSPITHYEVEHVIPRFLLHARVISAGGHLRHLDTGYFGLQSLRVRAVNSVGPSPWTAIWRAPGAAAR